MVASNVNVSTCDSESIGGQSIVFIVDIANGLYQSTSKSLNDSMKTQPKKTRRKTHKLGKYLSYLTEKQAGELERKARAELHRLVNDLRSNKYAGKAK